MGVGLPVVPNVAKTSNSVDRNHYSGTENMTQYVPECPGKSGQISEINVTLNVSIMLQHTSYHHSLSRLKIYDIISTSNQKEFTRHLLILV